MYSNQPYTLFSHNRLKVPLNGVVDQVRLNFTQYDTSVVNSLHEVILNRCDEVTDVASIQYYPHHLQSLILMEQAALRSKMVFLGKQRPAALTTVENIHFEDLLIIAALAQMSVIDTLILAGFSYREVANRMRIKLPKPFTAAPAVSHFGLTHMINTKNSTITSITAATMSYMPILELYVEDVDVNSIGSLYVPCVEIQNYLTP